MDNRRHLDIELSREFSGLVTGPNPSYHHGMARLTDSQRLEHPARVLVFARRLSYREIAADIGYSRHYTESAAQRTVSYHH